MDVQEICKEEIVFLGRTCGGGHFRADANASGNRRREGRQAKTFHYTRRYTKPTASVGHHQAKPERSEHIGAEGTSLFTRGASCVTCAVTKAEPSLPRMARGHCRSCQADDDRLPSTHLGERMSNMCLPSGGAVG
jgi:hypothetical protein